MPRGLNLYEYNESREIERHHFSFYALLAAAMRQADSQNMSLLTAVYPNVAADLRARYNAPGGELPGDRPLAVVKNSG